MRLPLPFRRESSSAAKAERQERLERAMTDGLRRLADLLQDVATRIEQQRLSRRGTDARPHFLERTDSKR